MKNQTIPKNPQLVVWFIALISLLLPISQPLAKTPLCNFTFTNYIHCTVNIQVDITCGGTTYTYQGSAVSANCGSPQNTTIALTSTPLPDSCNFSGCNVTLTINGQSKSGTFGLGAIDMNIECLPGAPCGGGFNKMSVHFNISGSGFFTNACCF